MQFQGLTLDKFQEDAILAIENNESVVVSAPTGSGKTLIADYIINRDVESRKRVVYTAPIKALSNQKFKDFTTAYGEKNVGLMTGDMVINPDATVLVMTTEIYRNMVLVKDRIIHDISYVIFDEIHYINDRERGTIWEESIIFSPKTLRFLCLSATIPNAQEFASWIQDLKEHDVAVVKHHHRPVPLQHVFYDEEIGITTLEKIREQKDLDTIPRFETKGKYKRRLKRHRVPFANHIHLLKDLKNKLPCIFFTFSRADTQIKAQETFQQFDFLVAEERAKVSRIVNEFYSKNSKEIHSLNSARLLRSLVHKGIAFHHAGVLPRLKELVEELFTQGLIKVLYATETFAVGINMPAKTVVFNSLKKYDGISLRYLNSKEYFQIAGRAGRRGIDKKGLAIAVIHRPNLDFERVKALTSGDTEAIMSQFRLSYNTILNLIHMHNEDVIMEIISSNFYCYQNFGRQFRDKNTVEVMRRRYANIVKMLTKMGYLENGSLTEKGHFARQIFADEILITELFATDFYQSLNEYQMLLVVACVVYEHREKNEFYDPHWKDDERKVEKLIVKDEFLRKQTQLENVELMSCIVYPMYHGKKFLELLEQTNLLEGDIIRMVRQMVDRIMQIRHATKDSRLRDTLENCVKVIDESLEGIHLM